MKAADPPTAARLEQCLGAKDVRAQEGPRIEHGAAVVGFRGKVDDHVHLVFGEQMLGQRQVPNVALDKGVALALIARQALEVRQVPRVRQEVQVQNAIAWIAVEPETDEVRADEAGPASYQDATHCYSDSD